MRENENKMGSLLTDLIPEIAILLTVILSFSACIYIAIREDNKCDERKTLLNSTIESNYNGAVILDNNLKNGTFIYNGKKYIFTCNYDNKAEDKTIVVYEDTDKTIINGVYVNGVQNYRKSDNSKLDDTSPQNAN